MSAPLISICLPAFRAEKFLPEALESIRSQTFRDWELIVTEDGSSDRTESMVQQFAEEVTQRVTYGRHLLNLGLPSTRNTGMRSATGEWIAFLDADDVWMPDHLEKLVQAAGQGVDLVYAGCQIFDDATGLDIALRAPTAEALEHFEASLFTGRIIIQPSAAMVRRSAALRAGQFATAYPICNDMEYWVRLTSEGGTARYSGAVTCRYRKHGLALSLKSAALITETARICEAYSDWNAVPKTVRRRRPAELYRYAAQIIRKQDPKKSRTLLARSLELDPFSIRSALAYCTTFVPVRRHAHPAAV